MSIDHAATKKIVRQIKQTVADNADCDVAQALISAFAAEANAHSPSKETLFLALANLLRMISPDETEAQFVWVTAFASFVSDIDIEREPVTAPTHEPPVVLQ